jgi:hypothetical protein
MRVAAVGRRRRLCNWSALLKAPANAAWEDAARMRARPLTRLIAAVVVLATAAALAAVAAPASGAAKQTCLTYAGETLLDVQGVIRVYAASVPDRPTPHTVVRVYACKPGHAPRTQLVVEHDDSDGGYTCAPATTDADSRWLALDCAYVGGTFIDDHIYEFPFGTSVGQRVASLDGGSLVGVSTSGGLAVVDECDQTLEVADASGVRVVAPASVTDPAVGGAHVYWTAGTTVGSTTPTGHPKGSLTTPGSC